MAFPGNFHFPLFHFNEGIPQNSLYFAKKEDIIVI